MLELIGQVLAYSGVGLVVLVGGFFVIDLLTPGKLGVICETSKLHPAALVTAAIQLAVALVVCASLT